MTIRAVAKALLLLTLIPALSHPQKMKETDWKAPLAGGGAPECPEQVGSRTLRSETASDGVARAIIVGTTVRTDNKSCRSKADLIIFGRTQKRISLPGAAGHSFSIIDFSPDGRSFLLETGGEEGPPDWDYRSISVAVVNLVDSRIHFLNAWDLFKWGYCYATIEPQGFTTDGKVILLARPSVFSGESVHNNCVSDWGLYATDLASPPVRLSDDTMIPRFGKAIADQVQACRTDPDIVDACFTVHGRLSAWNGSPTLRIWKVGTNRILGDHEDWPLPEKLAEHLNWDIEAWGNFEVCPFTKERPGVMQMVCIESASDLVYRKR